MVYPTKYIHMAGNVWEINKEDVPHMQLQFECLLNVEGVALGCFVWVLWHQ